MGLDPVVYGGGILKSPIVYNKSGLSNIQFVDAPTPTAGGSITAYCDPAYDGIDFAGNVYFDGTNWVKYDATKPAHSLYHDTVNDRSSLWRSAVSEAQGAPIANWVMHTILETDVAGGVAGLDANSLINRIGQASLEATPVGDFESGTDIYHAHDAATNGGYGPYGYKVLKTITLEHSPSPTAVYRVYFELNAGGPSPDCTARIYVNGAAVGAALRSTANNTYVTQTENITGLAVGDTIELWVLNEAMKLAQVRNFRILCDTKGLINS